MAMLEKIVYGLKSSFNDKILDKQQQPIWSVTLIWASKNCFKP